MRDGIRATGQRLAGGIERAGIISVERLKPTFDLAWPRIVVGISLNSKQTVDLALIGIAVGTTGTAGLAFALAYWQLVLLIGLGLSAGTVSLVSQNYGADEIERGSLVIRQSMLIAIGVTVPVMAVFVTFGGELMTVLGAGPESAEHGRLYLLFIAPAVGFELFNLIASRTYTGVGDTFTEMVARTGGAVLNVILSALFIFGFGMDVAGAALGTTVSTAFVAVGLAWGMWGRSYGFLGMQPSPVTLTETDRWIDREILRQLVEISAPEIGRWLAEGLIVFPLLWVAAMFGPVVVTALEVGRQIRRLINSLNWGLALACSSLVGQHLGANEETEAGAYGRGIIRLGVVSHAIVMVVVIAFAWPIATLFVSGTDAVTQTAIFVVVGAVSALGHGLHGTATGVLIGAGDTRWPFVSSIIGRWVLAFPAAIAGALTPLGVAGLYIALLVETYIPGGINYFLFKSGRWKAVSRRYRTSVEVGSDD